MNFRTPMILLEKVTRHFSHPYFTEQNPSGKNILNDLLRDLEPYTFEHVLLGSTANEMFVQAPTMTTGKILMHIDETHRILPVYAEYQYARTYTNPSGFESERYYDFLVNLRHPKAHAPMHELTTILKRHGLTEQR